MTCMSRRAGSTCAPRHVCSPCELFEHALTSVSSILLSLSLQFQSFSLCDVTFPLSHTHIRHLYQASIARQQSLQSLIQFSSTISRAKYHQRHLTVMPPKAPWGPKASNLAHRPTNQSSSNGNGQTITKRLLRTTMAAIAASTKHLRPLVLAIILKRRPQMLLGPMPLRHLRRRITATTQLHLRLSHQALLISGVTDFDHLKMSRLENMSMS